VKNNIASEDTPTRRARTHQAPADSSEPTDMKSANALMPDNAFMGRS
jgi:hypothetical protein